MLHVRVEDTLLVNECITEYVSASVCTEGRPVVCFGSVRLSKSAAHPLRESQVDIQGKSLDARDKFMSAMRPQLANANGRRSKPRV